MDMKENILPGLNLQQPLGVSKKINIRSTSITNLTNDIEAEKQYLSKLKTQRHKTQKLHSEYIKLRKEKDVLKDQYEQQIAELNAKISQYKIDLDQKNEQNRQSWRQVQKMKNQLQRIGRDKNQCLSKVKNSYEETFNDLRHNIQSLTENIESKNKNIASLKKTHANKIKELQNQIFTLEQQNRGNVTKAKNAEEKFQQAEKNLADLHHRYEKQEFELNRVKTDGQIKAKQIIGLKNNYQRVQQQYSGFVRQSNCLEEQIMSMKERISILEKEKQKFKERSEELATQVSIERSSKMKLEGSANQKDQEISKLKHQISRKDQSIRQYQAKVMSLQEQQIWKQRIAEKEAQNEDLLEAIKTLKEQNQSLMHFIKQRQALEKQRRALMENQMEQICKFENLLRDVN